MLGKNGVRLKEKEKNTLLSALMSLHEKGERFHLSSSAIPIELYDDIRNWVNEAIKLLAPYNKGKHGLNLDVLERGSLQSLNIGEAFMVLAPVVERCVERIKIGSLDSWFYHLTMKEMQDCVGFL